jgi:hypothetical protein
LLQAVAAADILLRHGRWGALLGLLLVVVRPLRRPLWHAPLVVALALAVPVAAALQVLAALLGEAAVVVRGRGSRRRGLAGVVRVRSEVGEAPPLVLAWERVLAAFDGGVAGALRRQP